MVLVEQAPAETYLRSNEIPYDIALHEPTETAIAEARVMHLPFGDVLKTVMLRVGEEYRMAIIPASRRLDIRTIHRLVDAPVRLATEAELARDFHDYELGAIPPLPDFLRVRAFVDEEVFTHDAVAFADGRRTESMIVDPKALFWGQDVYIAPITRDPLRYEDRWSFEGDSVAIPEKEYFG